MLKSRIQAWVDSSHGLAKADQWLVPVLQGLGRLDRDLFDETPTITANLNAQRTAPHTVSDYQVDQFDRYIYISLSSGYWQLMNWSGPLMRFAGLTTRSTGIH